MDESRRMKFIKQYDEKLQELLKREENAPLKKKLSKYFFKLANQELTKGQVVMLSQSHNPKKVVWYLSKFTENTHIKYATHLWDGIEDKGYKGYEDFIEKLNGDLSTYKFNELTKYHKELYWKLIYPFLFQKKLNKQPETGQAIEFYWGRHKLQAGWQYPPDLLKDPDKKPYEIEIPIELRSSKLQGRKQLRYFQDFIDVFKSEIEFRRNDLYFLIQRITSDRLSDFKIKIDGLRGLSFYTYTLKIEEVLKRIFKNMDTNFPEIFINGFVREGIVRIEILQKDSYSDKPIDDPKLNLSGGDFSLIYQNLLSLCDWSIQSRFRGGKYYEFKYLDVNNPKPVIEKHEIETDPGGFKYILTFYTKIDEEDINS